MTLSPDYTEQALKWLNEWAEAIRGSPSLPVEMTALESLATEIALAEARGAAAARAEERKRCAGIAKAAREQSNDPVADQEYNAACDRIDQRIRSGE